MNYELLYKKQRIASYSYAINYFVNAWYNLRVINSTNDTT